ncbi:hypothetical protein PQR39_35490 [Paraburkholderia sediminicola]|uniref:hypothetical protein n=1 Tax=Paraburkholderia sediminicola TaxID=458836 RepID=UPI0038BD98F9
MKVIQKHPLPAVGAYGGLTLVPGAVVLGTSVDNAQAVMYVESPQWGSGYVYWEIQVVREGDPYADGMQALGMVDDPNMPANSGNKLFVVGRING